MSGRERAAIEPIEHAGAVGNVWSSLAVEVRQEREPVGPCGSSAHGLLESGMVPIEECAKLFGDRREIHGAQQRQPAARR